MSRMKILNAVEQEQFESPPLFNSVQRKQYFDFSSELLTLAQDLQTPTNQVCFLVSCGYFKAAKRFFPNRRCSRRDLDYVAQKLGFQPESIDVNSYSATTRLRHERLILDFYGFRPFDSTARKFVTGAGLRSCYIPPAMGRSLRLKSSLSTQTTRSNISAKAKVLASTASSTSGNCYFTRQSSVPLNERAPT
jgi:Domain of unknown function (DUF4158)